MEEVTLNGVASIKSKISRIISLYEKAKQEKDALKKANAELSAQLKQSRQYIADLKARYDTLIITRSLTNSSNDTHDAKIKVKRMVREIDKCIALLNR